MIVCVMLQFSSEDIRETCTLHNAADTNCYLQSYISHVLAHPWVSRCLDVKVFLLPKVYLNLDLHGK